MNAVMPLPHAPERATPSLGGAPTQALLMLDERQAIVALDEAAQRLLGCGAEALGGSFGRFLSPRSRAALAARLRWLAAGPGGDASLAPLRLSALRAGGEALPLELEFVPVALAQDGGSRRCFVAQLRELGPERPRREAPGAERSRQALRRLSASVVEAREEERRRIARELHDELGQRLTALKMELCGLAASRSRSRARVAGMLAMLDDTVAAVRRIAADLRPLMLDDLGLDAAIEWLASDAARRLGLEVRVRLDEAAAPLQERVAIALYRMVQEALTNVGRHARASEVRIELQRQGEALVLQVRDNGIGFPERALLREGSFGLLGMRERARMLGGRFEIANPRGGGALVTVCLPLAPPPGPGSADGPRLEPQEEP